MKRGVKLMATEGNDKDWLNELISIERGWENKHAEHTKFNWLNPVTNDYELHCPDWHSDTYWPTLVRECREGGPYLVIEWDGIRARVLTYVQASVIPQYESDIGRAVCKAWARMMGILK